MSKLRKLNVSEVEGNEDSIFPPGTVWIDRDNSLRISDGQTEGGLPATSAADLGSFKIEGTTLGTKDNPDTGGWGGYALGIDPGGESAAGIYIPGLAGQANGTALQIYNRGDVTSPLQLFGRGGVQMVTGNVEIEQVFEFSGNVLFLPVGGYIKTTSAGDIDAAKTSWESAEDQWVTERDVDAADAAPTVRPWAGLPSYEAYDVLIDNSPLPPDVSQSLPSTANNARQAYLYYQELLAATYVGVEAHDKSWKFGADGNLTLPQTAMNVSPAPTSLPGITFSDGTFQTTAYIGDGGAANTGNVVFSNSVMYLPGSPAPKGFLNFDNQGTVTIGSNSEYPFKILVSGLAINKEWTFGTNGDLTAPGNIIVDNPGSLQFLDSSAAAFSVGSISSVGNIGFGDGSYQTTAWTGTVGNLDIANGHINFHSSPAIGTSGITYSDATHQTTAYQLVAPPTHSTGAAGDRAGMVAYDINYHYYCKANYGQIGHQVSVATAFDGATALNTNQIKLTKTADTLQITQGDIISDSDGGATSVVGYVSHDADFTYVGTGPGGSVAYSCAFPLTFTSTDYVSGGNIWVRVAWSGTSW